MKMPESYLIKISYSDFKNRTNDDGFTTMFRKFLNMNNHYGNATGNSHYEILDGKIMDCATNLTKGREIPIFSYPEWLNMITGKSNNTPTFKIFN